MPKDCWSNEKNVKSNTTTSTSKNKIEDDWEVEASFTMKEDMLDMLAHTRIMLKQINYEND